MTSTHERAQRAQQRPVWQLAVARLDRLAAENDRSVGIGADAALELGEQPGLADPGVTAQQDERRMPRAGLRQGQLQLRELGHPADEMRAGQPAVHG
ncbi:MAG TPA: hypothetical protein VKT31_11695 [Solirubrobacteraceae bacterium]|nr:hypothetical protein [Solirubrobacteraceae bacterium]